ncbi:MULTISPECIES: sigma-E factor negative regulatory protein [unclassified Halomonas]|uniref:sigma-E factor negative regulatory protein n=1 Tax=unclassified Halomonas TaxID=2609666 RepID=UPI0007D91289|nr:MULTISPECIES: sigma-E factor negative regulatory protein [unclassified Halomonas]MBT2788304.1 sigma-E factor negative regulatory protein [Halomonas sp. ISL-106]MBT2796053.1 sigma-E factor negative regulatory protein [Halomonas sp. ISL-104]OAL61322.1 anti-sigma factor [Halomonas sp. ALS9]
MSQNTRESLSVLMDGESDELELRRVLKALPNDDDAADTWRRYHLARSMMQREQGVDVSVDLSAGIMARLRDEPAPMMQDAEPVAHRAGGISFARGAGVAAAVSLMVITGVQFFGNNSSVGQGSSDIATTASVSNGATLVQPVSLASQSAVATRADMPMFEPTPFRLSGQSGQSGLMNISETGFSAQTPQGVTASQGTNIDIEQIGLLQSYLEQHTQSAAYGSGDSWMPLMRSSAVTEPLGQR